MVGSEVWVAHTSGRLSRIQRDPLEVVETFELADEDASPVESIALGADASGRLWVVSTFGGDNGMGVATRFDPFKEKPTAQVSVGLGPRGQGDITGSKLTGMFAEEASLTKIFDGCGFESLDPDGDSVGRLSDWQRLHVIWTAGVDSEAEFEARHAKTRNGLEDAEFVGLGVLPQDDPPYDVDFPDGGAVEIRLTLRAFSRIGAPRILSVGLEWTCPGPD